MLKTSRDRHSSLTRYNCSRHKLITKSYQENNKSFFHEHENFNNNSFVACNTNNHQFDAAGTFEVDEVVVSSEIPGKILSLTIREGDTITKNKIVGEIDVESLCLQKEQVQASIQALGEKKTDVLPVSYTHLRAHETVLDL